MGKSASKDAEKSDIMISKEKVTLWGFNGDRVTTNQYERYAEFTVVNSKDKHYTNSDRYWEFKPKTAGGFATSGFASRYYFYPQNFREPEETNTWYFGALTRQETKELLMHEANGDGSYLVRYSEKKRAFILSLKFFNKGKNEWMVLNYNVRRSDPEGNKGQYFLDKKKSFHNMEDLLANYTKPENVGNLSTHLTNTCFVPNPDTDKDFRLEHKIRSNPDIWIIPRQEIKIEKQLGIGNFGVVSLGTWRNETKVAVKELKALENKAKAADYEKEKGNFKKEMDIMKKINHPNLVKMYGICIDEFPFYLIQELCARGDLKNYLSEYKVSKNNLSKNKTPPPPDFDQLMEWCQQVASGMAFLEDKDIIHRDLAARNVLLTEYNRAKVADFGLAKDDKEDSDNSAFPVLWSSPEVLNKRQFSIKSDVWSFGVTVWEFYSFGDKPYGGMKKADLKRHLKTGNRMEIPFNYTKDKEGRLDRLHEEIMMQCWKSEARERPSFATLIRNLDTFTSGDMYSNN